jgi:flagellar biosynthesis/type III secretory pathway chaperone
MIETLIIETEKLTALIETETDRLLRERPTDIGELIEAKDQHAQSYLAIFASLRPLKSTLAVAPETVRSRLRNALAALDAALLRNGDILMRLQSRSRDLLTTIANALNPHSQRATTYGGNGGPRADNSKASIAINATV